MHEQQFQSWKSLPVSLLPLICKKTLLELPKSKHETIQRGNITIRTKKLGAISDMQTDASFFTYSLM